MVARFVNGKGIRGILHYNENKVAAGEAKLLLASGFAAEVSQLTLEQKLKRFDQLIMLNNRTKTNAIHISLNFDERDKLSPAVLQQIGIAYMERIGFGDQPYLVYQHTDAAHQHVHIATVNIRPDGGRIDTHGIGWKLSEPARMALEKDFSLVQAKGKALSNSIGIKSADLGKAVYGKTPTKRSITNIVSAVVRDYRFASLTEFNAVLRQFNVVADPGGENSLMRAKGGLLYSLVNEKGEQAGVPIKASAIYNKPTLASLKKEFERNKARKLHYKEPLKRTIKKVFSRYSRVTRRTFIRELEKLRVNAIFRVNDQGLTYGVTFIDNRNKTVFKGSDLGKAYSAKAMMARLDIIDKPITQQRLLSEDQARNGCKLTGQANLIRPTLVKNQPEAVPIVTRKKKKRKDQSQEQTL